MCLQDVSRAKLAALLPETVVAPSVPALKDEADRKPEYPKPDTNQMIPFQPRHLARMYCCPKVLFFCRFAAALFSTLTSCIKGFIFLCFSPQLQVYTLSLVEFSQFPQLLLS